jgi:hypothetical protein
MSTREKIASYLEDAMFIEPACYDDAILGIAQRADGMQVVAYDRQAVLEIMRGRSLELTPDEVEEFFEFNTAGAWIGDRTPCFVDIRWAE